MSDRDEFGAFLIGFLVGSVAGAVATLLLAPQTGEETRTVIKEKSIELRDKASQSLDGAYKQAEIAAEEARGRFDDLAKMTRERAEELQQRGQVVISGQKGKINEVIQSVRKSEPGEPPQEEAAA